MSNHLQVFQEDGAASGSITAASSKPSQASNSHVLNGRIVSHAGVIDVGPPGSEVGEVVRSFKFQMLTIFMIIINALWLGVDVEWNHTQLVDDGEDKLPLEPLSTVVAWFFCIFFSAEIALRFLAFHRKMKCLTDGWFVFDSTLVFFMALETWILPLISLMLGSSSAGNLSSLSSLRLIRLLRLARMGRLMQFFPELLTLVKGMVKGFSGTMFILLFLAAITYIFAIAFTSQVGEAPYKRDNPDMCEDVEEGQRCEEPTSAQYMFGSLGSSMMTLFTNGMLGDNLYSTLSDVKDNSLVMYWVFIVYFCISAMTLLNMLIGILCDVITFTASQEEASIKQRQFKENLRPIFMSFDTDGNNHVTQQEWNHVMETPALKQALLEDIELAEDEDGEEYLAKMKGCLFDDTRDPSQGNGIMAARSTRGIPFEMFLELMYGMLPEHQGTALEVEMLSQKMTVLDQVMQGRLSHVEDLVKALTLREAEVFSPSLSPATAGMPSPDPFDVDPHYGSTSSQKELAPNKTPEVSQQQSRPSSAKAPPGAVGTASGRLQDDVFKRKSAGSLIPTSMAQAPALPGTLGEPWSVENDHPSPPPPLGSMNPQVPSTPPPLAFLGSPGVNSTEATGQHDGKDGEVADWIDEVPLA
eukprot:CAMPEP_0178387072 /NCGR_PEP_ID=MMETSP0689_2-20121128/8887_1 /TAXON_ID=160604 /ORGANISM="Amphidinium massartii, Strain CS-259" /LENGTH=639 /DNA_ID=CAMNT_0020007429 /DNA_START=124 /DNA_END=2041 /DNA_ORIENTATION=+